METTQPAAAQRGVIGRRSLFTPGAWRPDPRSDHWIRVHRRAMACRFEVTLSGEDASHVGAAQAALDEVDRIEATLTVFRETSDLVRVNRRAAEEPVPVDEELYQLLHLCRELSDATGGAFDITTTPLSRCWGFLLRQGRLPSDAEITAARTLVGMDGVRLDPASRTVRFRRPGTELNLGSIGKGYALGKAAATLRGRGVDHALLSAGGSSVLALGGGRSGWVVDLHSRRVGERLARLRLWDGALATSGAGEQFVEVDGTRYGHVLDPRTGRPASGVVSVSVVAAEPAVADALATAFLVGGIELAGTYCAAHAGTLVLVTLEGDERPRRVGRYPGAFMEEARE